MSYLGIFVAVVFELSGVWLAASIHPSLLNITNFLSLHFSACLIAAMTVPGILPVNYRRTTVASALFIFSVTFFIPLIGMLGMIVGLVPALWSQQKPEPLPDWLHSPWRTLPARPAHYNAGESIGVGQVAGILQNATNADKRLEALIATLSLDMQHAMPLLRMALKDTDDNVRLLAFALIKRKETELNKAVRESMLKLEADNSDERFTHHKALASYIWELAHLETSSYAARISFEWARKEAEAALQLRPADAELPFLLGRILLKMSDFNGARDMFQRAAEYGIDTRKIMPFQAEIAFHEKRFSEVGHYLETVRFADEHFPLAHLEAYWNTHEKNATALHDSAMKRSGPSRDFHVIEGKHESG